MTDHVNIGGLVVTFLDGEKRGGGGKGRGGDYNRLGDVARKAR